MGVDRSDEGAALCVTANIAPHRTLYFSRYDLLGPLKAGGQFDLIALGAESGEISGFVSGKRVQVPRLQFVQAGFRHSRGRRNQNVAEILCDVARRWIPIRVLYLAGTLPCVSAAVAFCVAFRGVVVLAAFSREVPFGSAVLCPNRHDHTPTSPPPTPPLKTV